MAIILNIDTAVATASICLSLEAKSLQLVINEDRQDHASWLHIAIQEVLANAGLTIKDIEAIAVTIGPGSYTGLRVGLSTAKGLSFAMNIPLITINTLKMMANAMVKEDGDFFCPLIDARRMEVFTAVYNKKLETIIEPCAMILEPVSFNSLLLSGKVIFSGNGMEKCRKMINHPNALYSNIEATAINMISLSEDYFRKKMFVDVAYTEPFYIKEFHSPAR
jgi:tRNA threonylcarbamoyladenosine biosynthesis protein TsaB